MRVRLYEFKVLGVNQHAGLEYHTSFQIYEDFFFFYQKGTIVLSQSHPIEKKFLKFF